MSAQPGTTTPDHRGRTGLDLTGRSLRRNPDVIVRDVEVTSTGRHVLRRTTFDYRRRDGRWTCEQRETYDRGNGATILLYDSDRGTVLLTRQFRYPAYVNDHPDGMLVETAAGLLDDDDPEAAIRRETREELGVDVGQLTRVFDVYMSPGSVTERLHFYAAPYGTLDRTGPGGGLADDGEDIEVLEVGIRESLAMVRDGRIVDGKTIMLLQWAALEGPFAPPTGLDEAAERLAGQAIARLRPRHGQPNASVPPSALDAQDGSAPVPESPQTATATRSDAAVAARQSNRRPRQGEPNRHAVRPAGKSVRRWMSLLVSPFAHSQRHSSGHSLDRLRPTTPRCPDVTTTFRDDAMAQNFVNIIWASPGPGRLT